MTNPSPLVSIIIPTFNRAHLIGETLDSVLNQTYSNWECVVVDDGSTDTTQGIVTSYNEIEPRIRYYERPANRTKGANSCRNYGFEMSRGEYICWLDSDDLFVPDKIQFQLKRLINSGVSVSVTQSDRFRDGEKVPFRKWSNHIASEKLTEDLILGNIAWQTAAPLWHRGVIPEKPFNEKLNGAQEWYFHILQSIHIPANLFCFSEYSTLLVRESNESMSYSYPQGLTTRNYLTARTLLIHELLVLNHQYIPVVIQNSKRLLKMTIKDELDLDSLLKFGMAVFKYRKFRFIRIVLVLFLTKITGKGERLWQHL